jgi:hypothetical protein
MCYAHLDGRHERLKELWFLELAQEAQHRPPHVLVGVVEVIAQRITHQDHLTEQLLVCAVLGHDLQSAYKASHPDRNIGFTFPRKREGITVLCIS